MNALALLRGLEAPVRIVVANNDGGGIFELLPQARQIRRGEFEAAFGTPLGIQFEHVAAAHGLRYRRVEKLSELADAAAETALIEVPVSRASNASLRRRLSDAASAAVARALS